MKTVHIISTNIRVNLMEYRDLSFFYMNLQVVCGGGGSQLIFGVDLYSGKYGRLLLDLYGKYKPLYKFTEVCTCFTFLA